MIDNTNIKSATNRNQSQFEINRVVVESYTSIRKYKIKSDEEINSKKVNNDNNKDDIKENKYNKDITENINNIINIDNNKDINTNEKNTLTSNNQISNEAQTTLPSYSPSSQVNLTLTSHIKKFDLPLTINNSTLNYLIDIQKKTINEKENIIEEHKIEIKEKKEINEIKEIKPEKNSFRNNLIVSNSTLFIGGGQNLKGMRIHLSKPNYNNIVHKEITDFKISKNKSIENVKINLEENKTDIINNNTNNTSVSDLLKSMNKRWKEYEKEFKMRLTYISNKETIILNKKQYIDELIKKINITNTSVKNNTKESYILIKQDKNNKSNKFIYEVISPLSNKELETSVNQFILKKNDNLDNSSEFNMEIYDERTSQNYVYVNNGNNDKKKSKFNHNEIPNKKNSDEFSSNNEKTEKEYFNPVFIFNQKQLKYFLEILDEKSDNKKSKNNNSNPINNKKSENLTNSEKQKEDRLTDLNFNIYPVKVEKFEFIHTNPNEIGIGLNSNNLLLNLNQNNNIELSNIALNQSEYNLKQIKPEEEFSTRKIKDTEDFSQNTPISLLQEKYFLYAVSKWAKYSVINPQEQFVIKYFYSSGHPKFDSVNLDITNFTLWIEKIQTKKESKKSLGSNNSNNSNYLKTKSNNKINNSKSKVYKSGASIFLYESNYNNDNKKKTKSKPKLDKKKNQ